MFQLFYFFAACSKHTIKPDHIIFYSKNDHNILNMKSWFGLFYHGWFYLVAIVIL